jgi:hypothetical protein
MRPPLLISIALLLPLLPSSTASPDSVIRHQDGLVRSLETERAHYLFTAN